RKQGAKDVERPLHRPRGDQHLRHEVVAALEARAHLLERRDESVVEDPLRLDSVLQPALHVLAHLGRLPHERVVVEVLKDLLMGHAACSSFFASERRRLSSSASLVRTGRSPEMRDGVRRIAGPERLSAAITSPVGPRTGAAMALSPTSSSSMAVAKSSARMCSSSPASRSRSRIVCGVSRARGPSGSWALPNARNTLP